VRVWPGVTGLGLGVGVRVWPGVAALGSGVGVWPGVGSYVFK
jgi:hypothetical protein